MLVIKNVLWLITTNIQECNKPKIWLCNFSFPYGKAFCSLTPCDPPLCISLTPAPVCWCLHILHHKLQAPAWEQRRATFCHFITSLRMLPPQTLKSKLSQSYCQSTLMSRSGFVMTCSPPAASHVEWDEVLCAYSLDTAKHVQNCLCA